MGKKIREYKSGDFIFAKVKGFPAWPARVQSPNGKKYFVYFYGTGETANLGPNKIFDYAENKDKFLSKSVKRRDFNDGVKQIEYDFANNVPLEDVLGAPLEPAAESPAYDTVDDSAIDLTLNDSAADTTVNDTVADDPAAESPAYDTVDDSAIDLTLNDSAADTTVNDTVADDPAAESPAYDTVDDSAIDLTLNDSAADTTVNDTVADDPAAESPAYDTVDDSAIDATLNDSAADTTVNDTVADDPAAEAPANDTANDSAIDLTLNDSAADTTVNDTGDDANATQNDATVEDSDETGALVIDEGKTPAKGRKSKAKPKPKETPKAKKAKTPRGRGKKAEETISRCGWKIRPKRYIDEQSEDNATLPSPAPKRRRGASPPGEREKADAGKEAGKERDKDGDSDGKSEKSVTQFNVVRQSELEGLKEAFKPADEDKENILIAYLPSGAYVGIRLFQARPRSFRNESARLQWDKQAARNALTLKIQLERKHITAQSVQGQLVLDLKLTDEEKATLDKKRETEEKKSRMNFLKTEMKLIELAARVKTCICLEKADTELCLKLLDDLLALEVKPLMLLKHPTSLETVKVMRAYIGNTPSWDLNETDALAFSKQAHEIRKKADLLYMNMKEHFQTPEGLSFWEYFSERVVMFKKVTATLNAGELMELVHEPAELSHPSLHTMQAAIEMANKVVPPLPDSPALKEGESPDKETPAKSKKPPPTPSKKRTRGNKKDEEATEEAQKPEENADSAEKSVEENGEEVKKEKEGEANAAEGTDKDAPAEPDAPAKETNEDVEMAEPEKAPDTKETKEPAKNGKESFTQ